MKARKKTLCGLECKRIFSIKVILWMVVCLGVNLFLWMTTYRETKQDQIYYEVLEIYRGKSNAEKCGEIFERTAYYKRILDEHALNSDAYAKNKIGEDEYQILLQDYKFGKRTISGWERLQANAERFENMTEETYFLYDVAWEKVFQKDAEWVFNLLLITLLIPFFYMDRDAEYHSILQSFCHYKRLKQYRLFLAIATVLLLQLIWMITEGLVSLSMTDFPDSGATLRSLPSFAETQTSFTLSQFLMIMIGLKLLKRVLDVYILSLLSHKIQSKIQTTVLAVCYLLASDWYITTLFK